AHPACGQLRRPAAGVHRGHAGGVGLIDHVHVEGDGGRAGGPGVFGGCVADASAVGAEPAVVGVGVDERLVAVDGQGVGAAGLDEPAEGHAGARLGAHVEVRVEVDRV